MNKSNKNVLSELGVHDSNAAGQHVLIQNLRKANRMNSAGVYLPGRLDANHFIHSKKARQISSYMRKFYLFLFFCFIVVTIIRTTMELLA